MDRNDIRMELENLANAVDELLIADDLTVRCSACHAFLNHETWDDEMEVVACGCTKRDPEKVFCIGCHGELSYKIENGSVCMDICETCVRMQTRLRMSALINAGLEMIEDRKKETD